MTADPNPSTVQLLVRAVWRHRAPTLVLLLFAATRLLFLLTSPHAWHVEECKPAALAVDLARGDLRLPFWLYLDSPHAGGSVFAALVAAPLFALLGNTAASAKLSGLLLSLLTVALIFGLVRPKTDDGPGTERDGWTTAAVMAALFVVCPPHYLQKSVVFVGNVLELTLGAVLMARLLPPMLRAARPPRRLVVGLGLVTGLGLWIQLGTVALLGTVLLLWFVNDRLFFVTGRFALFVLAAAVGFSPFVIYNLAYDFVPMRVDQFAGESSLLTDPLEVLWRLAHLLTADIPRSFHFFSVGPLDGRAAAYLLYGVCLLTVAALVVGARRSLAGLPARLRPLRRRPVGPLVPPPWGVWLVYIGVVVALFAVSPMPLGTEGSAWNSLDQEHEHYLVFLLPLLLGVAAAGLLAMLRSRRRAVRWVGVAATVLAAGVSAPCFVRMVGTGTLNPAMLRPADCVCGNVRETGVTFRGHPAMMRRLLGELDPAYRLYLLQGAAFGWYQQGCDLTKPFDSEALNRTLDLLDRRGRRRLLWAALNTPADECPLPRKRAVRRFSAMLAPRHRPLLAKLRRDLSRAPQPIRWTDCFDRRQ